jgi:hypothetical protein
MSAEGTAHAEETFAAGADAIRRVLDARFGAGLRIVGHTFLHQEESPVVVSVALAGAPIDSAVAKFAKRGSDGRIDDDSDAAWKLANEWATLAFLTEVSAAESLLQPLPVPEFYGGDRAAGVVVMADLGAGDSLANVLLRSAGEAPGVAAEERLGGWVDSVARIHLATFGRTGRYRELREPLGRLAEADPGEQERMSAAWLELADRLGVEHDSDVETELALVAALVAQPGDWEVVSIRDLCPDNNRVRPDGSVWLFDAEYSAPQHALLDVAYLHATMPSCWCVRRLPAGLADRLVTRYAGALAVGGRDVGADFTEQLALCRVQLALWRGAGSVRPALSDNGDDHQYWDTYDFTFLSQRQQVAMRCEQVVDAAALHPRLPAVADWAARLHTAIRLAWLSSRSLPLYPAFD